MGGGINKKLTSKSERYPKNGDSQFLIHLIAETSQNRTDHYGHQVLFRVKILTKISNR
jgi:hypothetical protein